MKKRKKYAESFKRQVVLEVLNGRVTKEEARLRYNIGGKSLILEWMRVYAGHKQREFGFDPVALLQDMKEDKEKIALEQKIRQLEAELEYAKLKGRAYQVMVEIAKRDYNLDLEKKPGAKRSQSSRRKTRG